MSRPNPDAPLTRYRVVNEVAKVMHDELDVTVIPASWYKEILLPSGKADQTAILLLAEIVYWHRPKRLSEPETWAGGETYDYTKRFAREKYHLHIGDVAEKYGMGKQTVSDALKRLEKYGLVEREESSERCRFWTSNNPTTKIYITIVPEALGTITYHSRHYDPVTLALRKKRLQSAKPTDSSPVTGRGRPAGGLSSPVTGLANTDTGLPSPAESALHRVTESVSENIESKHPKEKRVASQADESAPAQPGASQSSASQRRVEKPSASVSKKSSPRRIGPPSDPRRREVNPAIEKAQAVHDQIKQRLDQKTKADPAPPPAAAQPTAEDLAAREADRQRRQREREIEAEIKRLERSKKGFTGHVGDYDSKQIAKIDAQIIPLAAQLPTSSFLRKRYFTGKAHNRRAAAKPEAQPQDIPPLVQAARRAAAHQMEVAA